jgi:hypothetical protein
MTLANYSLDFDANSDYLVTTLMDVFRTLPGAVLSGIYSIPCIDDTPDIRLSFTFSAPKSHFVKLSKLIKTEIISDFSLAIGTDID